MHIRYRDIGYGLAGETELQARLYEPAEPDRRGFAIVSVHGGAWCANDRTSAQVMDSALARSGLTVLALDFRQGPDFKYPAASQDIAAGVRYARAHASELAIDPDRIGMIGSSSGGQLVLLGALQPNSALHRGTPILDSRAQPLDVDDMDASVSYVIALWPVSDPLARYHYAREAGMHELADRHFNYFNDEAEMQRSSIQRVLDELEHERLPPAWIAQPGADKNVPQWMTLDLLRAYQDRGGAVEYAFFPGQAHGFAYDDTPATQACFRAVRAFIQRQLAAPHEA